MTVSDGGTSKNTALKATPAHTQPLTPQQTLHPQASPVRSKHQGQRPPYSKIQAYPIKNSDLFKGRGLSLSDVTHVREPSLKLVWKKILTNYLLNPHPMEKENFLT